MSENSSEQSSERRRGERIPINEELSGDGSTWVSDLSVGGVFVHTAELLPVGSTINLRFTVLIDDPMFIEAIGRVVRHSRNPPGMGVQFESIPADMAARIEEVLARQQPIDSGEPLRLPEPRPSSSAPPPGQVVVDEDEPTRMLSRPAPVNGLRMAVASSSSEDDETANFDRPPGPSQSGGFFRPPPSPSEVDEDDKTRQFPTLGSKKGSKK